MASLLDDLAAAVQAGLEPLFDELVYRSSVLFQPKVATAAPAGAVTISLTALPAGLDRVLPGDSFGGGVYVCTAEVAAVAGVIPDVPFTPALKTALAAGATVSLSRATDTPCRGNVEWLDTSSTPAPGVKQGDARATVPVSSLPFVPRLNDKLVERGRTWNIENVGRDGARAAWLLLLRG